MTPRQRMLDAFDFNAPDKIPVVYQPSPAGVYYHGHKLLDLFNEFPPDNPADFRSIPSPPPDAFNPDGRYHQSARDDWGTEWEYLIFGVAGHPKAYPFSSWEAAADYEFPSIGCFCPPALTEQSVDRQRMNYLTFAGWISIFEKLHALRPMDEVFTSLLTRDEHLLDFLDRLVEHWKSVIERFIEVGIDVVVFGDDWGGQNGPLVSPEMFREVFRPRYQALMEPIQRAGRRVFFHSCGNLGGILDELFDLGIAGLWPQITCYENDAAFKSRCKEHRVAIYIHPDRQRLIPLGTPREIEEKIAGYSETYHALNGGGIFNVEIENDAPFENVEALVRAIDIYR